MGRLFVDELEPRRLFAANAAPIAAGDALSTDEDAPLVIYPGLTSLYLESDSGEYVGQGLVKTWTRADGAFSGAFCGNYGGEHVEIDFWGAGDWHLDFAAPAGAKLVPGAYPRATRYPFHEGADAGLDVSGDGRGENELFGEFTILQLVRDADGVLRHFAADFEQNGSLRGTIRYNFLPPGHKSGLLANDADPEGKPLTARLVTGPAHGTLTLAADGTLSYVPDHDFAGVDQFTYVANDGTADSKPATVKVTVNAVNDPPTFARGKNQSVPEDAGKQTVPGWATFIMLGGAAESGQSLSFAVVRNPAPSLFAVQPAIDPKTGTLTYTPRPDAVGTATIDVVLRDTGGTARGGENESAVETFTITLKPANDAPSAAPDTFTVAAGRTLTVASAAPVTRLFFNSQEGDWIGQGKTRTWTPATGTFAGSGAPGGATVTYADDEVDWRLAFGAPVGLTLSSRAYPDAGDGPDEVPDMAHLSVSGDGRSQNESTGRFTLRQLILGKHRALRRFAADFEQRAEPGSPALFGTIEYNYLAPVGVLANDADVDSQFLTAVLRTAPEHGSLTLNADGSFTYTPKPGYVGTDSFTYRARDGAARSNVATARIVVTAPAAKPYRGAPFSGQPIPIAAAGAAVVQAENFDRGADGVAYHDADAANTGNLPGYRATTADINAFGKTRAVVSTRAGEWLKYTLDVAAGGVYGLDVRLASATGGGKFHVEVDGVAVGPTITAAKTGGRQSFVTLRRAGFALKAGRHVLTLKFDANDAGGFVANFDWLKFTRGPL